MKQTPLAEVKERFGDKDGLVKAVKALAKGDLWLDRTNDDKGLDRVSNAKLLHLHRVFSEVTEAFGNRAALVSAILEVEKRTKDDGYKARLEAWPTPRLWDHYRAAKRRADRAAKKAS